MLLEKPKYRWETYHEYQTEEHALRCWRLIEDITFAIQRKNEKVGYTVAEGIKTLRESQSEYVKTLVDVALRKMGIKVISGYVLVNASGVLADHLLGTPYTLGRHFVILQKYPGAMVTNATTFTVGKKCKAVALPL